MAWSAFSTSCGQAEQGQHFKLPPGGVTTAAVSAVAYMPQAR